MTTTTVRRQDDLKKATAVLACAMGLAIVNGAPVETTQTFSNPNPDKECADEFVSVQEGVDVVVEPGALEHDRAVQLTRKFKELVQQWRDERSATSSVAQMAMLSSYQQIIGMGPEAIPMILGQLKSEGNSPSHWFWALASITRENPVPKNSRGKLLEMANAWFAWGEKEGYV